MVLFLKHSDLLNKKISAYVGAILCTALWGTAFPLIRLGYRKFEIAQSDIGSKLLFAGERFALAGVLVFLFGLIFYRKPPMLRRKDLLPIALLGLVQTTMQYLFAYIGVGFTTATNTSILTGTVSIISVVLSGIFFRQDRLTALKIAGCVIGLFGIIYVNIFDFSVGSVTFFGDIIVLMSSLSGAGGNIITKKVSPHRNPTTVTAWQLFIGGVVLLIIGLICGGRIDHTNISGVIILLWLSLVSSVSFLLWTELLKRHPVSRITVFMMLIPIFGTVWSGILLGEDVLSINNLISLALIAAGIVLVNIKGNQNDN